MSDYPQKMADMKRYGCLDGDNARRCVRCDGRFDGGSSSLCPHCNNLPDKMTVLVEKLKKEYAANNPK